jgi:hypothetical protein
MAREKTDPFRFDICDLEFFFETKKFLSRSNWPLFRPAAGLNPEPDQL